MPTRVILTLDATLPDAVLKPCRELCLSLANLLGEPVLLASLDADTQDDLRAWVFGRTKGDGLEGVEPAYRLAGPADATPLARDAEGRIDWATTWESFGELALYGGAPLRQTLLSPSSDVAPPDVIDELKRGIWQTTGLFAEAAQPGWLAVSCQSAAMAAWLCAAIVLENVLARCEDETLLLPAAAGFAIEDEVRSVVAALAKTARYWQTRLATPELP